MKQLQFVLVRGMKEILRHFFSSQFFSRPCFSLTYRVSYYIFTLIAFLTVSYKMRTFLGFPFFAFTHCS